MTKIEILKNLLADENEMLKFQLRKVEECTIKIDMIKSQIDCEIEKESGHCIKCGECLLSDCDSICGRCV